MQGGGDWWGDRFNVGGCRVWPEYIRIYFVAEFAGEGEEHCLRGWLKEKLEIWGNFLAEVGSSLGEVTGVFRGICGGDFMGIND